MIRFQKDGAKLIKFDVDNAMKKEIRRKPSNKESEVGYFIRKPQKISLNCEEADLHYCLIE